jgi:hypothetical protein
VENLSIVFNGLQICLKNRQTVEGRRKQGKIVPPENFSAKLSTKAVDFFPLALGPLSLQPRARIDVSERPVSA